MKEICFMKSSATKNPLVFKMPQASSLFWLRQNDMPIPAEFSLRNNWFNDGVFFSSEWETDLGKKIQVMYYLCQH